VARGKVRDRDGVYQRKDRPGTWWISYMDAHGKRRQRKAKGAHTLTQAREQLDQKLEEVRRERHFGTAPAGVETFSNIAGRYLKHQQSVITPKAYERTAGVVEKHLKPFFEGRKIADVRRVDVQRYITARVVAKASPGTVSREMNVLKRLFSLAVEWEILVLNPASGVKGPRVPAGRVRYLQPTELRTLLEACPDWLRPIAGLAVATGMRRGEILALRWLDVDRGGGRILLPQTKNGDGRVVYLNKLALQVIDSMPRHGAKATERIFPDVNPAQVSVAFIRACKDVGIEDFSLHDLRHTAASWLRMSGADIHTVAQLLGHKDLRMAARYQHLSPGYLSKAVKALDQVFTDMPTMDMRKPQLPAHSLPQRYRKRRAESANPN
jgi:integrase